MDKRREQLETQLSAYLDGELSSEERKEVEAFLAADASARTLLAELKAMTTGLQSLPRARASADVLQTVRSRIERRALLGEVKPLPKQAAAGISPAGRWAAAAAIVLMTSTAGYILWTHNATERPGSPTGSPLVMMDKREQASRFGIASSPTIGDRRFVANEKAGAEEIAGRPTILDYKKERSFDHYENIQEQAGAQASRTPSTRELAPAGGQKLTANVPAPPAVSQSGEAAVPSATPVMPHGGMIVLGTPTKGDLADRGKQVDSSSQMSLALETGGNSTGQDQIPGSGSHEGVSQGSDLTWAVRLSTSGAGNDATPAVRPTPPSVVPPGNPRQPNREDKVVMVTCADSASRQRLMNEIHALPVVSSWAGHSASAHHSSYAPQLDRVYRLSEDHEAAKPKTAKQQFASKQADSRFRGTESLDQALEGERDSLGSSAASASQPMAGKVIGMGAGYKEWYFNQNAAAGSGAAAAANAPSATQPAVEETKSNTAGAVADWVVVVASAQARDDLLAHIGRQGRFVDGSMGDEATKAGGLKKEANVAGAGTTKSDARPVRRDDTDFADDANVDMADPSSGDDLGLYAKDSSETEAAKAKDAERLAPPRAERVVTATPAVPPATATLETPQSQPSRRAPGEAGIAANGTYVDRTHGFWSELNDGDGDGVSDGVSGQGGWRRSSYGYQVPFGMGGYGGTAASRAAGQSGGGRAGGLRQDGKTPVTPGLQPNAAAGPARSRAETQPAAGNYRLLASDTDARVIRLHILVRDTTTQPTAEPTIAGEQQPYGARIIGQTTTGLPASQPAEDAASQGSH